MSDEVDMKEVKRALEKANLYEPNMQRHIMLSYFNAIKDSENMMAREESKRLSQSHDDLSLVIDEGMENTSVDVPENSEIIITPAPITITREKPFTPKKWTSEIKNITTEDSEHNNNKQVKESLENEELPDEGPQDATNAVFGFNEMIKNSKNSDSLKIINHKLKLVPIQCCTVFLKAENLEKAKLLYAYHTRIEKLKATLARQSFFPAPLPKVTSYTEAFPVGLEDIDFEETYVSRSGRQTKRKVYNYEDEDSLDGISHKKTKSSDEQEWLSKASSNKSIGRGTAKKADSTLVDIEKGNSENIAPVKNIAKSQSKPEARKPLLGRKTYSNSEIMQRSSLFADIANKSTRSEAMFDKMIENEEKKERESKRVDALIESLNDDIDFEEYSASNNTNEEIINVDEEQPAPLRTRVIPPIPGRKPISRKRTKTDGLAPLDIKINSAPVKKNATSTLGSNSASSQDMEEASENQSTLKKRLGPRRTSGESGTETLPSTSRTARTTASTDVQCPICEKSFAENKIQEHAATCGDEPVTRSSAKISRITCEICDKVVPYSTSYEVHVADCIKRAKGGDCQS